MPGCALILFPHRMPCFCRSGHPVVTVDQFGDFVRHLLPQEADLQLPRISGRELQEVAWAKSPPLAGWMDGLGMRLKLSIFLGSHG